VEFKSDTPGINAETIAEYVVCFANSKGGTILLGVEDDGTITGLKGRFPEYGTWISDAVQGWVHPNIIVDYLRDMEYIEGSSRSVSRKIIRGMIEHNGKEPAFELRGEALRVTLYA